MTQKWTWMDKINHTEDEYHFLACKPGGLFLPSGLGRSVQAASVWVDSNRGQGEGRGRGDWIVTQMCKTGGGGRTLGTWQTKAGRQGGGGGGGGGAGGEVGHWTMPTEKDRNKMPAVEERESIMGDFPERNALVLTYYTVCMCAGNQTIRWCSRSAYDCGVCRSTVRVRQVNVRLHEGLLG